MTTALPQMIIYLAAVRQARLVEKKINSSVFGILTDSVEFQFAFLSSEMKLFISKVLVWHFESTEILRWLDRILADSIDASPYTTPNQSRNITLFNYETALQRHSQFGAKSSDEDLVVVGKARIPPVNIFLKGDKEYYEVDRVKYMGRDLIVLEHESDDESDAD